MLENKFTRAAIFFVVAFGVPVILAYFFGDVSRGIQYGVVMGLIFAIVSQFFEPKVSSDT